MIGVVMLTALLPAGASGAVIHVPTDYPTIWEAVDAAVSGDSVIVAAGTWTDTDTRVVSIGGILRTFTSAAFLKGGVTVIGAGPGTTIIDAQGAGTGFVTTAIFANDPGEVVLAARGESPFSGCLSGVGE
jgi:hypothetical protein